MCFFHTFLIQHPIWTSEQFFRDRQQDFPQVSGEEALLLVQFTGFLNPASKALHTPLCLRQETLFVVSCRWAWMAIIWEVWLESPWVGDIKIWRYFSPRSSARKQLEAALMKKQMKKDSGHSTKAKRSKKGNCCTLLSLFNFSIALSSFLQVPGKHLENAPYCLLNTHVEVKGGGAKCKGVGGRKKKYLNHLRSSSYADQGDLDLVWILFVNGRETPQRKDRYIDKRIDRQWEMMANRYQRMDRW